MVESKENKLISNIIFVLVLLRDMVAAGMDVEKLGNTNIKRNNVHILMIWLPDSYGVGKSSRRSTTEKEVLKFGNFTLE